MRIHSALLFAIFVLGFCQNGIAQNFKSAKARQAEQKFLRAMKAARADYIANLKVAAKLAIKDNEFEEAVRIQEKIQDLDSQQTGDRGDVVVKLRRHLTNTTWSFNRPRKPATISFLPKNVVVTSGQNGLKGVWESLGGDTAIANFGEDLFLFRFDKKVTGYSVRAFGPIKTEYTTGQKSQ